jgi:Na+/H+ antiporter NhaD/arsenite permease-like protein
LSFVSFLTHLAFVVLICWIAAVLVLRRLFRTELAARPTNLQTLAKMNANEALTDARNLRRVLIVLAGTLVLFFLQDTLHVSPAFIALAGASVALLWIRPAVDETLKGVEWSVLLFFAALFIIVGGLQAAGVLHGLSVMLRGLEVTEPVVLGLLLMWFVALLSAIVDNIPITIAIIPIILDLGATGVNVTSLWWALALGAGLGGNGTIIGSTANVIVASVSERTRTPITARLWSKRGLPVMLVTLVVASILYVLMFEWMNTR